MAISIKLLIVECLQEKMKHKADEEIVMKVVWTSPESYMKNK